MPDQPPTLGEPWKWLCYRLQKDWLMITKAPIAFLAVLVISLFLTDQFVWKTVVPAKEEQLKSKDATIQQKDATIEQLRTVLAVNGLNTFPLKKRAIVLAYQLDESSKNYPTNLTEQMNYAYTISRRFLDTRVPNILYELDQQGAHSDELDDNSPLRQELRNTPIKPESVRKLAQLIRSLASRLKD